MRLIRCNRCAAEQEIPVPVPNPFLGMLPNQKIPDWRRVTVEGGSEIQRLELCLDCTEVFLLQFMEGARVEAITKPAEQTPLPHAPMHDCLLLFNPGTGGFICRHDDQELYDALAADIKAGEYEPPKRVGWSTAEADCLNCGHKPHREGECRGHVEGQRCLCRQDHREEFFVPETPRCSGCKHLAHRRGGCRAAGKFSEFCRCNVNMGNQESIPEQSRDNGENAGE